MAYKVLTTQTFASNEYSIRSIHLDDRFAIMRWRNEQLDILRQKGELTEAGQTEYFHNVVAKDFDADQPRQILFSFLKNNEMIGYGGLVHIHWEDRRAEVSFLLETSRNVDQRQFKREYAVYLSLIKIVAFNELHFNKLTTEAFDLRPYLIETLEENGFIPEGRLKRQNLIGGKFVDSLLHACFNPAIC